MSFASEHTCDKASTACALPSAAASSAANADVLRGAALGTLAGRHLLCTLLQGRPWCSSEEVISAWVR